MKFGFIGAGKVGFSLGKYFAEHGQMISGYYSEFEKDAIEAADFTGSKSYSDMKPLVEDSDVLFLTVPDGQIENTWNQLKELLQEEHSGISQSHFQNKIVCHCSGALSSEVFSEIAKFNCYGYSIHPLFAVSDRYHSYKELSGSYFTIEGDTEKISEIQRLFETMGNPICVISKEAKVKYHAAAAIASNLVLGLIYTSEKLLKDCGFDEQAAHSALAPIIYGNVMHGIEQGTVEALTGPIERNDVETVKKHLAVLDEKEKSVYAAVSKEVVEIAQQKNPQRDYQKIMDCFKDIQ